MCLKDLLMLADVNKILRKNVCGYIFKKNVQYEIVLKLTHQNKRLKFYGRRLILNKVDIFFQMLRCFGEKFTTIKLMQLDKAVHNSTRFRMQCEQYIKTYCYNLAEIDDSDGILYNSQLEMQTLKRCSLYLNFPNLTTLSMSTSLALLTVFYTFDTTFETLLDAIKNNKNLQEITLNTYSVPFTECVILTGQDLDTLATNHPNLQRIHFHNVVAHIDHIKAMVQHLPHLHELCVHLHPTHLALNRRQFEQMKFK